MKKVKLNTTRDSSHYRRLKAELKTATDIMHLFRIIAEIMTIRTRVKFKPTSYDSLTGDIVAGRWSTDKNSGLIRLDYFPNIGEIAGVSLTESLQEALNRYCEENLGERMCIYRTAPTVDQEAPIYTVGVESKSILSYGDRFGNNYANGIVFSAVKTIYNIL